MRQLLSFACLRPRRLRTIVVVATTVTPLLAASFMGAASAAAAPSPGYTATLIPTGAVEDAVAVNSKTDTAYFADSVDSITVLNGATNAVSTSIPLTGSPAGIALNTVTNTIYVTLTFSTVTSTPAVAVIDGATNTVTDTIALPGGYDPQGVAVDSSTDTVYVAEESVAAVAVIDGSTNSVTATISTGSIAQPYSLAVDETSDVVWVGSNQGAVLAISGATNTITQTISLGGAAVNDVAVDPATSTLYAVTSNNLAVISTVTGTVASYIPVSAQGAAVNTGSGTVFASTDTGSSSGTTWVIDASNNTVVDTLARGGFRIAVNTQSGSAYAAPSSAQRNAAWVLTPSATNAMSPVISSTSATFTAGLNGSFAIQGSALPAASYSETGALPSGVTLSSSGILSGTPADGSGGLYPITITASNGVAPDYNQAFNLVVYEVPTLTAPSDATFTVGTTVSVPIQVTGYPVPLVRATSLPAGVSLTQPSAGSWQLSGTPIPGSGGVYTAKLTGTNIAGSATASISITVLEAPVFTSAATTTFMAGTDNSYAVSVRGYPAATFAETGALPAGVTLSQAGQLSGNPAIAAVGTYNFTITASSSAGTASQAFTLIVAPPPPAFAVATLDSSGVPWAQAPQFGGAWVSLGGGVLAPPAVAAAPNPNGTTPASPLFIAPGLNHLLYIRGVTGSWQRLGPNDTSCLGAGAVITGTTTLTLTVACETTGHALSYNTATVPSSGLPQFTSAWTTLGGTLAAAPAVAPVNGVITFFVTGVNNAIYVWPLGSKNIGTNWACLGGPAAAAQPVTGQTLVACQGTNHGLYIGTALSTGLSPPTGVHSPHGLIAGPAISAASAEIDYWALLSDNEIWERIPGNHWVDYGGGFTGVQAAALN